MKTGTKVGLASTLGTFGLAFAISQVKGVKPLVVPAGGALDPTKDHTLHVTLKNPTDWDWTYRVTATTFAGVTGKTEDLCKAGEEKTYDIDFGAGVIPDETKTYDLIIGVQCVETGDFLIEPTKKGTVDVKRPRVPKVTFVGLSWD